MERAFHLGLPGKWWNNPLVVNGLGLTADQQKRMEEIFEQSRPDLMQLSGNVRTAERAMDPLLGTDQPDESKVLAQIDQVAQARAQLEKANARMLLGLRRVLTIDQWKRLEASDPSRHPCGGPGFTPGVRGHGDAEDGPGE